LLPLFQFTLYTPGRKPLISIRVSGVFNPCVISLITLPEPSNRLSVAELVAPGCFTVMYPLAVLGYTAISRAGAGVKMNPIRKSVPLGVVTVILPLAPLPTTASTTESDTTVNEAAGAPPSITEEVPVKCAPVMVIVVPSAADAG